MALPRFRLATNGTVTGAPTVPGSFSFTVAVTSGDGQGALQPLSMLVHQSVFCGDSPDTAISVFEDANLESAVRTALSITAEDELTCSLLQGLAALNGSFSGIESLAGIENLTSLSVLRLLGNSITDIGPLSRLTNLSIVRIWNNSISDLSPLGGLTSLTTLELEENAITDISPLSALTNLTTLLLDYNSGITDIGALRGLTRLTEVNLSRLILLTDVQPLLDNTGLGGGDPVWLERTLVSCADVTRLRAKGVEVISGCP